MPVEAINQSANSSAKTTEAASCVASLCADGVSLAFGGQQVLKNIDLEVRSGQIAHLRGGNGSGKTTLLNILSGFLKPDSGQIKLVIDNQPIDVLSHAPATLARLGLARLWQDTRLFASMTVLENVLAASPRPLGISPVMSLLAYSRVQKQEREFKHQAMTLLDMLGMADRAESTGERLSGGQAKRVAIARMLQTGAEILLLDEPLAGLDKESAVRLVEDLNLLADDTRKAMLIVEHNHDAISPVCDISYTLENGFLRYEEHEGQ